MGNVLDKRFWIGCAAAVLAALAVFALAALLVSREWISEDRLLSVICAAYILAALLGGGIAVRGKEKRLPRSLLVCGVLYLLIWIVALSSGQAIRFLPDGLWITASLLIGALAAAIVTPTKARKGRTRKSASSRPASRKRSVT